MRIFKTRGMGRFTRKEGVSDASLVAAIERAGRGLVDADLGGGLIKQRVAREGQGRSGGYRMIIGFRAGNRAVFLYGFAKSDLGNIGDVQLAALRRIGQVVLDATAAQLANDLKLGNITEVNNGQD